MELVKQPGAPPFDSPLRPGYLRPSSTPRDPALSDFRLGDFILALPVLVFSLVAHEVAHAWTAWKQGDDTAYSLGRITLNPLPHIDPFLSILLPLLFFVGSSIGGGAPFIFGGAKPVPVVPRKFRQYVKGDLIVSSAGVITNLLIALGCAVAFVGAGLLAGAMPGLAETAGAAQRMLTWGIWLNLTLCFFNLIPIPPLDGSRLLYHLLPPRLGEQYRGLERFGFLPLLALLWFARPVMAVFMTPAYVGMRTLLGLVLPYAVGDTWNIFDA